MYKCSKEIAYLGNIQWNQKTYSNIDQPKYKAITCDDSSENKAH